MSMTLNKLEPNALVGEQVFDAIHRSIINGELKAGERLRIRNLAEQLGTSVMPVREALRRLEEGGLVETVPYRGAVVKGFTAQELLHIYAVRRVLEVEAARLGTVNLSDSDVVNLHADYGNMMAALKRGDLSECLAQDENFLSRIYSASGNPVLTDSIERLWTQCRAYKLIGAQRAVADGTQKMLWEFQEQMLAAAAARDGRLMARLNESSILAAMERIRAALPAAEDA